MSVPQSARHGDRAPLHERERSCGDVRGLDTIAASDYLLGSMNATRCVLALCMLLASCVLRVSERSLLASRAAVLPPMPVDVVRENVEVRAADGVVLRGWRLRPSQPRRTLLFFYGNAGSVLLASWSLHWLARALSAEVYAFDYRGYGFSDGEPSVDRFADDALTLCDVVVRAPESAGRPLLVVGQSMGGMAALHVAARRDVAAVVLFAPVSSVDDVVAALSRRAPALTRVVADEGLRAVRVSPLADLRAARAPTLVVSASRDEIATPEVIRRFLAGPGPTTREGCAVVGGHGDASPMNAMAHGCVERFVERVAVARPPGG